MPSTNNATTSPKCLNANEIGGATDSCQRRWTPNSVHRTKRQPKTSKDGGKAVKRRRPFLLSWVPDSRRPSCCGLRERSPTLWLAAERAPLPPVNGCPRRHCSRNRETGKGREPSSSSSSLSLSGMRRRGDPASPLRQTGQIAQCRLVLPAYTIPSTP